MKSREVQRTEKPESSGERDNMVEDHEWEDLPTSQREGATDLTAEPLDKMASLQTAHRSTPGTPRKRRQGQRTVTRTIYIATNGASPRKPPPRTKASSATRLPGPPLVSGEEIHTAFTHGTRSSAKYIYDVVTSTLSLLKWPLVLLLTMWTITIIISALSATVRSAFSPLCVIPGVSRFDICATRKLQTGNIKEPQHAEYPMMVEVQSKTFEQLLDESVGSTSVALDIKKAEMATADLVILVRMSDLRGKDHLATALGSFVDDARETARGLQKLNAKISGSVDNILAISDFALQTIEGRSTEKSSLMKYIWPFNSNTSNKELLASTFSQSLSVLSSSLERLILSAEASLDSLNKLEEQLNTIHGIVSREDNTLSVENAELLAALWTRLGGNRAKVVRFASNLQLLKELGGYRAQALARVVAALQALQELSANMEELRERASTPELAGDEIPVEVHARAIRSGVDRLNEGRLRAKRLEEEAVNRVLGLDAD